MKEAKGLLMPSACGAAEDPLGYARIILDCSTVPQEQAAKPSGSLLRLRPPGTFVGRILRKKSVSLHLT